MDSLHRSALELAFGILHAEHADALCLTRTPYPHRRAEALQHAFVVNFRQRFQLRPRNYLQLLQCIFQDANAELFQWDVRLELIR